MKYSEEKYQRMLEKQKAARQKSYERHQARLKDSAAYRRRDYMREIRLGNERGSHVGCFRGAPGAETDEHLDMKYHIWKHLKKQGHEVMTEVIFNNNRRCDILDLSEGVIYEVFCTETIEELAEKVKHYPEIFEIRRVNAKEKFKEELLL